MRIFFVHYCGTHRPIRRFTKLKFKREEMIGYFSHIHINLKKFYTHFFVITVFVFMGKATCMQQIGTFGYLFEAKFCFKFLAYKKLQNFSRIEMLITPLYKTNKDQKFFLFVAFKTESRYFPFNILKTIK